MARQVFTLEDFVPAAALVGVPEKYVQMLSDNLERGLTVQDLTSKDYLPAAALVGVPEEYVQMLRDNLQCELMVQDLTLEDFVCPEVLDGMRKEYVQMLRVNLQRRLAERAPFEGSCPTIPGIMQTLPLTFLVPEVISIDLRERRKKTFKVGPGGEREYATTDPDMVRMLMGESGCHWWTEMEDGKFFLQQIRKELQTGEGTFPLDAICHFLCMLMDVRGAVAYDRCVPVVHEILANAAGALNDER